MGSCHFAQAIDWKKLGVHWRDYHAPKLLGAKAMDRLRRAHERACEKALRTWVASGKPIPYLGERR